MAPGLWLVLYVLAVWRVTRLVVYDKGPGHVFLYWRELVGIEEVAPGLRAYQNKTAELFGCPYCLSVWFAMPAAVGWAGLTWAAVPAWLGIAGATMLLELVVCVLEALEAKL